MAKLTEAERAALPGSAFVFPAGRRYPIHDKDHAKAALMDCRGTKDEQAVRAAVKSRYPEMNLSNATPKVETIDLTRHVRTPAGVAYFHLPIGSPIGGGGGSVSVRPSGGSPTPGFPAYHPERVAPKAAPSPVAFEAKPKRRASMSVQSAEPFKLKSDVGGHVVNIAIPEGVGVPIKPKPAAWGNTFQTLKEPTATVDAAAAVNASMPSDAEFAVARKWWTDHPPTVAQSTEIKKSLGIKFPDMSLDDLRQQGRDKGNAEEVRKAYREEYVNRVKMAKESVDELNGIGAALTKQLQKADKVEDWEPIIGETLAKHPHSGALGHLYDYLRRSGYRFKKAMTSEVAADKAGDVVRSVVTVLIAGVLLHFGLPFGAGLFGGGGG